MLTELETHRRLITAQIKREVTASVAELRKEMLMRYSILEERIKNQQQSIDTITRRLMDLALTESKLINETERVLKRSSLLKDKIDSLESTLSKVNNLGIILVNRND